jgi:hypothetical protein
MGTPMRAFARAFARAIAGALPFRSESERAGIPTGARFVPRTIAHDSSVARARGPVLAILSLVRFNTLLGRHLGPVPDGVGRRLEE